MRLEVRQVTKRFGPTTSLSNVSVNFDGTLNLILGPNGSGKTTLLNSISGLTIPDSGTLIIDGKEYDASKKTSWLCGVNKLLPHLGVLADKYGLPANYSGRQLLKSTAQEKTDAREWIEYLIDVLEMTNYVDKRIGSYSSGMTQKLAIAASLANRPGIILWDEPTANLDSSGRQIVTSIVEQMVYEHSIFLIATHFPMDFDKSANWIGIMSLGKMVKSGKLSEFSGSAIAYEALTDDPRKLAAALLEKGIALSAEITDRSVLFTTQGSSSGGVGSPGDLSVKTSCHVAEIVTHLSTTQFYRSTLQNIDKK